MSDKISVEALSVARILAENIIAGRINGSHAVLSSDLMVLARAVMYLGECTVIDGDLVLISDLRTERDEWRDAWQEVAEHLQRMSDTAAAERAVLEARLADNTWPGEVDAMLRIAALEERVLQLQLQLALQRRC